MSRLQFTKLKSTRVEFVTHKFLLFNKIEREWLEFLIFSTHKFVHSNINEITHIHRRLPCPCFSYIQTNPLVESPLLPTWLWISYLPTNSQYTPSPHIHKNSLPIDPSPESVLSRPFFSYLLSNHPLPRSIHKYLGQNFPSIQYVPSIDLRHQYVFKIRIFY